MILCAFVFVTEAYLRYNILDVSQLFLFYEGVRHVLFYEMNKFIRFVHKIFTLRRYNVLSSYNVLKDFCQYIAD